MVCFTTFKLHVHVKQLVAYWKAFIKNLVARCKVAAQVTLFIKLLLYSCMQWMILLICDTYISLYLWNILYICSTQNLINSFHVFHPSIIFATIMIILLFFMYMPLEGPWFVNKHMYSKSQVLLICFHITNLLGLIFLQSFITTQTLLQVSNKINCERNLWS